MSACITVTGERGRGRKTWEECVADDMRKLKLKQNDAQDRALWRDVFLGNRPTRASADKRTLKR